MRAVCRIGRPVALGKQLERYWGSHEAAVVGTEGIGGGMEKSKGR